MDDLLSNVTVIRLFAIANLLAGVIVIVGLAITFIVTALEMYTHTYDADNRLITVGVAPTF